MTGREQAPAGDVRVIPRFIGPASLVGVCVGTLFVGLPLWLDARVYWLWTLPLLGIVLVPVPGWIRQFGTGLLLSLATVPSLVIGWVLLVGFLAAMPWA